MSTFTDTVDTIPSYIWDNALPFVALANLRYINALNNNNNNYNHKYFILCWLLAQSSAANTSTAAA